MPKMEPGHPGDLTAYRSKSVHDVVFADAPHVEQGPQAAARTLARVRKQMLEKCSWRDRVRDILEVELDGEDTDELLESYMEQNKPRTPARVKHVLTTVVALASIPTPVVELMTSYACDDASVETWCQEMLCDELAVIRQRNDELCTCRLKEDEFCDGRCACMKAPHVYEHKLSEGDTETTLVGCTTCHDMLGRHPRTNMCECLIQAQLPDDEGRQQQCHWLDNCLCGMSGGCIACRPCGSGFWSRGCDCDLCCQPDTSDHMMRHRLSLALDADKDADNDNADD